MALLHVLLLAKAVDPKWSEATLKPPSAHPRLLTLQMFRCVTVVVKKKRKKKESINTSSFIAGSCIIETLSKL